MQVQGDFERDTCLGTLVDDIVDDAGARPRGLEATARGAQSKINAVQTILAFLHLEGNIRGHLFKFNSLWLTMWLTM